MIGKSLSQAAKLSGVPKTTLHRWKEKGKLTPDIADAEGALTLYSEAQIERARKLYNGEATIADDSTCAGGNSEGNSQAEVVDDDRADDVSNDELPESIMAPADNGEVNSEAEGNPMTIDTAAEIDSPDDNGEATELVTTPAQVDNGEVNSEAEGNPMTIDTAAEIIPLAVRANRIRQLQADVSRCILQIGHELIAAKKEIGHGNWGRWLQKEFEWTERTARNFMSMAERFGNRKTFSDLKPSTLQAMLALPEGDESDFIDAQVEKGKPIEEMAVREVKNAVKEWKAKESAAPNALSFEKTNVTEIPGEYMRLLSTAPNIDDAITAEKKPPIAHNSNSSVEYFTPAKYIEAARSVLGEIDVDPASCALANLTVKAERFFSADNDGLQKEWRGRIWLNPPFTSGVIEKFVGKLIDEISAGNVTSAIVLVDNATETSWFEKLVDNCAGLVFTKGRINFLKGGTSAAGSPTRGQVFVYFGADVEKFFRVFQQFGWAAQFVKTAK